MTFCVPFVEGIATHVYFGLIACVHLMMETAETTMYSYVAIETFLVLLLTY